MSSRNKDKSSSAALLEHEKHDDDDDGDDGNTNSDVLPSSKEKDNEEEDHIVSSSDGKVSSSSQHSSNGDTSSNDKVSSQTDETDHKQPQSAQSSFAVQLMNMMISETAIGSDSVRWLPSGNGIEIRNQIDFTSQCLPRYFNTAVFQSFLRRLYRWGFKSEERATAGSGQYVFFSETFHRDNNKYLHMKALPRSKPKTQETTTNRDERVSSLQPSGRGDSTNNAVSSSFQQLSADSKRSHKVDQDRKIRADTSSLDRHHSERYKSIVSSSSQEVANPRLESIPPQQQFTPQNRLLVEQLVNSMRPQTAALSTQTSASALASQLNPMQQQIHPTQAALIHQLSSSQQGMNLLPYIQHQTIPTSFANTALQQHQMHQAASNHQLLIQVAAQLLLQQHGASVFRQESTNSNNDDTITTTSEAILSSNDNDRGSSTTRASTSLTSNNDEDINTSSNYEDSQGLNASTSNRKRERSPSSDK